LSHHFGFIPVRPSALLDEAALDAIAGDYQRSLEAIGGERWAAAALPDDVAQSFFLVATGGTEKVILDLHDPMPELMVTIFNLPVDSFAVRLLKRFERWSIWFSDLSLSNPPGFEGRRFRTFEN